VGAHPGDSVIHDVGLGGNVQLDDAEDDGGKPSSSVLGEETTSSNVGDSTGDSSWILGLLIVGFDVAEGVGTGEDDTFILFSGTCVVLLRRSDRSSSSHSRTSVVKIR
jgi:hypothetical protein